MESDLRSMSGQEPVLCPLGISPLARGVIFGSRKVNEEFDQDNYIVVVVETEEWNEGGCSSTHWQFSNSDNTSTIMTEHPTIASLSRLTLQISLSTQVSARNIF